MSGEYCEYKGRKNRTKENVLIKRLKRRLLGQTVVSIFLFLTICFCQYCFPQTKTTGLIRQAVLYEPDTSAITETVKYAFKNTKATILKEVTKNENKTNPEIHN